ncbi:hypothetical protein F4553_001422 [Allocatelliglobosispora scoriae]|uniref:DUF4281 domain-containing protein n=1 Tax=Allocatelliglobosispora scoriae TaxID=643052 RepID=A0A841BM46_9ACTN|nr:ABA4-like family protein [Allocatelliglobosispora scoriae]MBB5868043.1 hypothetical protein [Allocatelliglobosispora scoriae]
MNFEVVFPVAAPFWLLMILAPGWSVTRRIAGSPLMVVPSLIVYFIAVAPVLADLAPEMVNPTLPGVLALLSTKAGTIAVWAHLIAFDLFVGRWIYLDSRERALHPLLMAPILILTILLSPFGLALYLILRSLPLGRTPQTP